MISVPCGNKQMYCFKQNKFLFEVKIFKKKQVFSGTSRMITEICQLALSLEDDLRFSPEGIPTFPYALSRWKLWKRPDWLTGHYRQSKWVRRSLPCQQNLADAGSDPAGWFRCTQANQDPGSPVSVTPGPVLSPWSLSDLSSISQESQAKETRFWSLVSS